MVFNDKIFEDVIKINNSVILGDNDSESFIYNYLSDKGFVVVRSTEIRALKSAVGSIARHTKNSNLQKLFNILPKIEKKGINGQGSPIGPLCGCPDYFIYKLWDADKVNPEWFFVEVKAPGDGLSSSQWEWLLEFGFGEKVYVVTVLPKTKDR